MKFVIYWHYASHLGFGDRRHTQLDSGVLYVIGFREKRQVKFGGGLWFCIEVDKHIVCEVTVFFSQSTIFP